MADEYLRRGALRRSAAISRVLERAMGRAAIGNLRKLREAAQNELAMYPQEIEAEVERTMAVSQQVVGSIRAKALGELRCWGCDAPIVGARRFSRRYCSGRCRQRAFRQVRT
jgi:hypothetical protein